MPSTPPAPPAVTDPKARILHAAMRCFADKGYAATTIADIERAAGFSPRAGGTYRHFRSKEDILTAALDAELAATREAAATMELDDPVAFARQALAALDRQRDLVRVMFRDLDAFPELFDRMIDELIQRTYRGAADRLRTARPDVDAEALTALSIGTLVNFKIIQAFTGRTPNDVDDERFARAWASVFGFDAARRVEAP